MQLKHEWGSTEKGVRRKVGFLEATHKSVTNIINFFILRTKINFKLNDQSLCAVNPVGQLAKACTHNKNLN